MYQKSKSNDTRFLRDRVRQTEFFVKFSSIFLPFYPLNHPKNQNFLKIKKIPGDIILLHMCTINEDQIIYGSWNERRDTYFFVILGQFLSFHPSDNPGNQNFEKLKKIPGDVIILHMWTINENQMMHGYWNMERSRFFFFFFFIFDCFLCFCLPVDPENQKFWNNEKNKWKYYHFAHVP